MEEKDPSGVVDLNEAENHPLALDSSHTDETEGLFPSSGEHPGELIHIRTRAGLKLSLHASDNPDIRTLNPSKVVMSVSQSEKL